MLTEAELKFKVGTWEPEEDEVLIWAKYLIVSYEAQRDYEAYDLKLSWEHFKAYEIYRKKGGKEKFLNWVLYERDGMEDRVIVDICFCYIRNDFFPSELPYLPNKEAWYAFTLDVMQEYIDYVMNLGLESFDIVRFSVWIARKSKHCEYQSINSSLIEYLDYVKKVGLENAELDYLEDNKYYYDDYDALLYEKMLEILESLEKGGYAVEEYNVED